MLSWALLASACPGGRPDPGLCPGDLCSGACAVGFALPPPSPPSCSRPAAPSAEPPPEPLRAAPGPAVRAAALRELGALSRGAVAVTVPGSPRASPPSWVLLQLPASPFPPGKVGAAPAPPGRGSPVLGTLAPASARLLAGPSPLEAFVPLFLFPRLPTLIEARTPLTVAFQVFSL